MSEKMILNERRYECMQKDDSLSEISNKQQSSFNNISQINSTQRSYMILSRHDVEIVQKDLEKEARIQRIKAVRQ